MLAEKFVEVASQQESEDGMSEYFRHSSKKLSKFDSQPSRSDFKDMEIINRLRYSTSIKEPNQYKKD